MLLVSDDDGAVGELDFVARPPDHHVGGGHHAGGPAVGADQFVTDADLTHRRPASRRRERRVQRQGLAHTGPGRDDDHLSGMQSVGELVEFHEAGRHTLGDATLRGDGVDLVHRGLQQLFERHEILGGAPLGDVVDLGLSTVDDVVDVGAVGTGVAVLHDPGARLHQPAQQRLLADDPGVVPGVRGGRHRRDQGVQIGRAAHPAQQPAPVQFGGDGDRVGGLTAAVEVEDRVVDELVGRAVEVAGTQSLEDVGDGVLAEQHAAEHGLFGGGVLRGLAAEVLAGRRLHIRTFARSTQVIDDSHAEPHPLLNAIERTFEAARRDCRSGLRHVFRGDLNRSRDGSR